MKYKGKRRMTKAIKQMARERRAVMFEGMTVEEISHELPIATAYLYEFRGMREEKVGVFVPDCPICGATHLHGAYSEPEGIRSPVCLITDEPIPNNYQLQIDWSDQDNVRLAKKYNIEGVEHL
ncbi:hypothetical protein [Lysinibacillus sp. LZ02]|uniref:hypothetical protein n=1 Tax=Lysinibacillus sp. LZ02 TaxID=3420668 RepID=UPI003D36CF0B